MEEEIVCITRGGYDSDTAVAHADVTTFVRDGLNCAEPIPITTPTPIFEIYDFDYWIGK